MNKIYTIEIKDLEKQLKEFETNLKENEEIVSMIQVQSENKLIITTHENISKSRNLLLEEVRSGKLPM